jgi:hypothetical protein
VREFSHRVQGRPLGPSLNPFSHRNHRATKSLRLDWNCPLPSDPRANSSWPSCEILFFWGWPKNHADTFDHPPRINPRSPLQNRALFGRGASVWSSPRVPSKLERVQQKGLSGTGHKLKSAGGSRTETLLRVLVERSSRPPGSTIKLV